ncbi:MAG: hypothetical protein HY288_19630 [Planctomycetia bacterium]|nr:hypothetical protein [Planctomycetia bacterium]
MQLDQARIAIRERSWLDNLDLALQVIRAHGAAVATSSAVGIVPMFLVNVLVTKWWHRDFEEDTRGGYWFLLSILVMIEAPLATAPLTLYLGRALFVDKPAPRETARDFVSCLPQLLLLQFFLRILLIVPVLTWIIPYALWPFLNEVILLERNPLVGREARLSTLKRNSSLHRSGSGDFLLRAIAALALAGLLLGALVLTQDFLLENLFGFHPGWNTQIVTLQLALWLVVIYFAVARFLSYLDQRIRDEGWEVELQLRAERERLARQML